MKIGFIGQGFIGKNYANDFVRRGYQVVRYALEEPFVQNRLEISDCDIVFVAVPTPTTPSGFDASIVEKVISLVGVGKIVVIKSTLVPGTTKTIQDNNPDKVVLFSPEFLCEATAAYDAAHPMFNILGMAHDSAGHRKAAEAVQHTLPQSDHNFIVRAEAAELFKYIHNIHGFMRVVFSNLLYDTAGALGVDWSDVKSIMDNDPMMSPYYNAPSHKGGRGAGGNCFIKDMAAFTNLYSELLSKDAEGIAVLKAMETKNLSLLKETQKDQGLVSGVYGVGAPAESKVEIPTEQPVVPPTVSQQPQEQQAENDSESRRELHALLKRYK